MNPVNTADLMQFTEDTAAAFIAWAAIPANRCFPAGIDWDTGEPEAGFVVIETPAGDQRVDLGDWVARDATGFRLADPAPSRRLAATEPETATRREHTESAPPGKDPAMGWSLGYDTNWKRDVGYGVPARCDHPGCCAAIDRGLAFVCGGQPYGGQVGCGLFFCPAHQFFTDAAVLVCERCVHRGEPFAPSPDVDTWVDHKLAHDSWARWRAENPDQVHDLERRRGAR